MSRLVVQRPSVMRRVRIVRRLTTKCLQNCSNVFFDASADGSCWKVISWSWSDIPGSLEHAAL